MASEQATMTSHVNGFPPEQGTSVIPSWSLPSVQEIPLGSLIGLTGMTAETNERAMRLFRACMSAGASRRLFLQIKP